jgi:hypothetical protein
MSKNFELLYRIGQEQGTAPDEFPSAFDVSAILDDKPRDSRDTEHGPSSHPHASESVLTPKLDSSANAEILKIVNALFLSSANAPHYVIFCGVGDDNGSGATCVSVAKDLSNEVSSRVCLVDAKALGVPLEHWCELDKYPACSPDSIDLSGSLARRIGNNLWFLSAEQLGSMSVSTRGTEKICAKLLRLRQDFGYLLVHTPPLGTDTLASVLGQVTDGVVLALEANETRRVSARTAKETLEAARVQLLGTVLNNRTFPIPEKLYRRL